MIDRHQPDELARLVAAERASIPTAATRDANWSAIATKLAVAPAAAALPAAAATSPLVLPTLLAGTLMTGLLLGARPTAAPPPGPELPPIPSAVTEFEPTPPPPIDPADDQLQTIRRAYLELRAGRPAAALTASDHYIDTWPDGMLLEEAEAARVLALCALDRPDLAAARARFLQRWPHSLHGDRIHHCKPATDLPTRRTQDLQR